MACIEPSIEEIIQYNPDSGEYEPVVCFEPAGSMVRAVFATGSVRTIMPQRHVRIFNPVKTRSIADLVASVLGPASVDPGKAFVRLLRDAGLDVPEYRAVEWCVGVECNAKSMAMLKRAVSMMADWVNKGYKIAVIADDERAIVLAVRPDDLARLEKVMYEGFEPLLVGS